MSETSAARFYVMLGAAGSAASLSIILYLCNMLRSSRKEREAEVAQLREELAALRRRAAAAEAAAAVAAAQAAAHVPNGKAANSAVVERRVVVEVPVERVVEREVYVALTPRRGEHVLDSPPPADALPAKGSPVRGTC